PGRSLATDGTPTAPDAPSLTFDKTSSGQLAIAFESCITGRLDFTAIRGQVTSTLTISDSIVDATEHGGKTAIDDADALSLSRVTVLGKTLAATIDASDTIFDRPVTARQTQ